MRQLIKTWSQITAIRYLFVGGSSYAIELSCLFGLIDVFHASLVVATSAAYWVGLFIAFTLQKLVAFQDYRRELKIITKQGALFGVLTVWNWVFTVFVVHLFPEKYLLWSRTLALVIMSGWNFFIYKHLIFVDKSSRKKGVPSTVKGAPKTSQRPALSWWKRLLTDPLLSWSVVLVVGWRLLLEVVNQLVGHMHQPAASMAANLQQWAHWDGAWYLSIIQHGYHSADRIANVAFFPSFPETVGWLAHRLHVDALYVGLLLNVVVTIVVIYLLMKLAQLLAARFGAERQQKTIALLSGVAFLAYFSSFFLAAFYADAFLVLGFVGAVYCAYTKRLWLSAGFAALATASKITGIVAVTTIGIIVLEEWVREHGSLWALIKRWLICACGALGIIGYMLYQKLQFGDPLLFYKAEKLWGRTNDSGFFVSNIAHGYYRYLFEPSHFLGRYNYLLMVCIMLLPFVVSLYGALVAWRYKVFWPLALGLLTIIIPLSTSIMESLNRYVLVLAPMVPFAFIMLRNKVRPALLFIVLGLSGVVMLGAAYGFLDGRVFAG